MTAEFKKLLINSFLKQYPDLLIKCLFAKRSARYYCIIMTTKSFYSSLTFDSKDNRFIEIGTAEGTIKL